LETFPDLYPFNSHYLDRDGLRYHYLDEGSGPPVVMLHGNPTWSFMYRDPIQTLRTSHRCIAPDHIGCGLSDKPGDEAYAYTLESRIADLDALIEHLGLNGKITLVLHDWGGMIGMAWAAQHRERIGRIGLFNTAAFHMPPGKNLPLTLYLCRNTLLGAVLVRGFNAFSYLAAKGMATCHPLPRDVGRAFRAPYNSWANRIATLRFVQDIPLKPGDRSYELAKWVDDRLDQLRERPVFIGWGARDFVFDLRFLAEWRRRLPDAEVHSFADAGHYVLEDAATELIPKVRQFVGAGS